MCVYFPCGVFVRNDWGTFAMCYQSSHSLPANTEDQSVPTHSKVNLKKKKNSTRTHTLHKFWHVCFGSLAAADLKQGPRNYGRKRNRFPANWKILQMASLK